MSSEAAARTRVEGAKTPGLRQVAALAGVSVATASAVLNAPQANTRVSEATRRRILGAAADLHYAPNAMARGLKSRRTNTLGVLYQWAGPYALHSLYSMTVLDGVVAAAGSAGYHVLLYTEAWDSARASTFSDRRTDGVIVVAPAEGSDVVEGLTSLGLPVAVVSAATNVPDVPYVNIDNRAGAMLALEHLRGLGHTRIAYATHNLGRQSLRERHDAYRGWMAAHNLTAPSGYVVDSLHPGFRPTDLADNALRLGALLSLPAAERPTAVLAVNDDTASQVLDAARSAGLRLPDDLSVVGFDDVVVASLTTPKLTTVRLPLLEMGSHAARRLIERIEGGSTAGGGYIIQPELVTRDSTAPAPPEP